VLVADLVVAVVPVVGSLVRCGRGVHGSVAVELVVGIPSARHFEHPVGAEPSVEAVVGEEAHGSVRQHAAAAAAVLGLPVIRRRSSGLARSQQDSSRPSLNETDAA
jgi:hypothetical protein